MARFTGGTNIYEGEARAGDELTVFRSGDLELTSTSAVRGPCRALVRPENIVVSPQAIRTSARNEFRAEVRSVRRENTTCRVQARIDERTMVAIVTPPSVRELGLEPGAEVYFSFKAHKVHLFAEDDMEGEPQ